MRILLVEDEEDLGKALQRSLKQEKYIVDWVQDGTEAWRYLTSPEVDYVLAIVDWMLPSLSGLEICKRLRSQGNSLPVLMLTAKDRIEDRVMGLDSGADDYLVKPFGMVELMARLRALLRRPTQVQSQILQVGNLILDYGKSTIVIANQSVIAEGIMLTTKEFQLLEYFMQHPNQILTRDQIMNRLWEFQAEPASNVVAAQIRLLRKKLAEYSCDIEIETIYGWGYRLNS
ncbi:two-component system response regulator RppA [Pseudanabaena sp. ABRG5-3]|uniref:two-component system response regulator RppA n=1 Tax=Pseudanabaena sp. ABRG5-3 TaxID=685565 RepID=UPI000DC6D74A|nr:two-component system response regulator RppA [Pseudanabaena sp. ABRG5-3]BBC26720.1 two-component response regulator [Pseudanabaena sp. ABRG5-3]